MCGYVIHCAFDCSCNSFAFIVLERSQVSQATDWPCPHVYFLRTQCNRQTLENQLSLFQE